MSYDDAIARAAAATYAVNLPKPYRKTAADVLQCPVCLCFNDEGAQFCDQCSKQLQENGAPYEPIKGDVVSCTRCTAGNQLDAVFCDMCGVRLAHAAPAAAVAAQQAATSSSGRRPEGAGMTPQERRAYLDARALREERARALQLPPRTGDEIRDLGAVIDHCTRVETLWQELDDAARYARAELGSWPDPVAVAACRQAEADAEMAWQARQAAVAVRSRMQDAFTGRTPEMDEADQDRMAARAEQVRRSLGRER
jgi:hypothetical protein